MTRDANRGPNETRAGGGTGDTAAQEAAAHPLRFGYGTNGLADLRLDDALALLADLGYDGVGLTLDHMHLDPLADDLAARTRRVARRLDALGLGVTVETGARYVLDPRRKHGPSLLDPDPEDRARRSDLLLRAVDVAADLGAHAVHCFSGVTPAGTDEDTAWKRLAESLAPVLDAAAGAGVPSPWNPNPGTSSPPSPTSTPCAASSATPNRSASPWTSATASASNRSLPPTACAPPPPGCVMCRSRTCAAASTNTSPSATARSTSRPSSTPSPPPATRA